MASPTQEQNKQVVRQFLDASDRQDTEKMRRLVSLTDYSLHLSGMPPMDWNGSQQFLAPFTRAFPDLHRNIEDLVAEGNKVAVRFTVAGTHKEEFQGIAPTGKQISFTVMDLLNINDGRIIEEWATADLMGLMQQI